MVAQMTSKLRVFKMPDSGVELKVRPISPMMVSMDMMRTLPKPKPPLQKIDMGDGDVMWERNYSSTDYEAALREWETELELKTMPVLILRALDKHFSDEEKETIKALRADFEDMGMILPKSDKLVWFQHVACGSDADFAAFLNFLTSSGEPSEEVVASIQGGFPGDVQGT
jgi:hypothetical protein